MPNPRSGYDRKSRMEYFYCDLSIIAEESKMAKSLFQEIQELINEENSVSWKYYQYWFPNISADTLLSEQGSISFIKGYFSAGVKESPLYLDPFGANYKNEYLLHNKESLLSDSTFSIDNLPGDRAVHTVSAFFLGILIENAMFGNNHLTARVNGDNSFTFPYIWFLTCLYHDFGYQFEQNNEYHSSIRNRIAGYNRSIYFAKGRSRPLKAVFRRLDISLGNAIKQDISLSHALYNELLGYAKNKSIYPVHYSNGAIVRNGWYNKQTINNYFDYRFWNMDVCDHGIVGGYLFLDRIIKNYATTYMMECVRQQTLLDLGDFYNTDSNLRFSKHQLPVFHHISNCILAHNVYKSPDDKVDIYPAYGLGKLIGTSFKPVCSKKDPLLYILSISDTLDPVKLYCTELELPAMEVLKNVYFDFIPGSKSIKISVSKAIRIEPIYEAANRLKEWTAATVVNKTNDSFDITL